MKLAGLIGGVAWPSTLLYYRLLNQEVQRALGGLHSAHCVLVSLDFAPVYAAMAAGRPQEAAAQMEQAARRARQAGAELLAILANTGHFAADAVQAAAGVPLVHIAHETAHAVRATLPGVQRLGVLGTSFALRAPFFGEALGQGAGCALVLPSAAQSQALDALIFGELAAGEAGGLSASAMESAAAQIDALCQDLRARGAQAIVLGCTELSLLKPALRCALPLLDTTEIHARAIVRAMLS